MQKIAPCLWFDNQAEKAARFYTGIFKNSKIVSMTRYGEAGREIHGRPAGSVMTVAFELDGQSFTALNGGPLFKDKYGVSWQVVPTVLLEMVSDPNSKKSQRAFEAMLQMKKLDIDKLKRAYNA